MFRGEFWGYWWYKGRSYRWIIGQRRFYKKFLNWVLEKWKEMRKKYFRNKEYFVLRFRGVKQYVLFGEIVSCLEFLEVDV